MVLQTRNAPFKWGEKAEEKEKGKNSFGQEPQRGGRRGPEIAAEEFLKKGLKGRRL